MSNIFPRKALAASIALIVSGNTAHAATCATVGLDPTDLCLENGNSVFVVDPTGGVSELNVDGNKHVFLQDFYYDDITLGNNTNDFRGMLEGTGGYGDFYQAGQTLVDGNLSASQTGSSSLSFFYEPTKKGDAALPIIRLDFQLIGGTGGSDTGRIIETFTIINRTNAAMDVSMFAYTDIDLGGSLNSFDDQAQLVDLSYTKYRQFDADFQMLATTSVAVDGYKIGIGDGSGFGGTVLDLFNAGQPNLNLGPGGTGSWGETQWLDADKGDFYDTGPGADLQMVAQWNRTLAAFGSFSYSHELAVSPVAVPVPAALPLALSGLGLLGFAGRRRKKANGPA